MSRAPTVAVSVFVFVVVVVAVTVRGMPVVDPGKNRVNATWARAGESRRPGPGCRRPDYF